MNKKISPAMIGAFVIGAVALIVIAILVFGSGRLFRQTRDFVLYFDNSVNGLRIGAPVKVKGVEIGSVKDIRLQLEKGGEVNKIPVIIEIDLEKLTSRGATSVVAENREALNKAIVDRGLRAQLAMESLVTVSGREIGPQMVRSRRTSNPLASARATLLGKIIVVPSKTLGSSMLRKRRHQ